ncbi:MAG TPA: 6,7-dimethyl-8-ribityllumazine synthase [Terriglobales bacterium]|nr:6,7-dimethyl-8-ribityllumazine synthase [Terriglobales bacterium]
MSGEGSPQLTVSNCQDLRVGIVAALWHETVMTGLVEGALRALREVGVTDPAVLRTPGSFDLPVVARAMALRGYDAVVALGAVIQGGTAHFEYVCRAATDGLVRVAVDTGVPVGYGLLTCETEDQALDRAGLPGSREDKGYEAALAAVAVARVLRDGLR